ncbi:MAG: hypothetical protein CMH46_06595 [Muricauda sp.]|nr:hypothetical protein [Allomuricauda sp.]
MNPMKILLYPLSLLFCLGAYAQAINEVDEMYTSKAYAFAVEAYEKIIESGKANRTTLLNAADANYFVNNTEKAYTLYDKAFHSEGQLDSIHFFRYYQTLRGIREYKKADSLYVDRLRKSGEGLSAIYDYMREVEKFGQIESDSTLYTFALTNLDSNTQYSEFAPVIHGGHVIFSSSVPGAGKELYAWNNQPFLSLYKARVQENGSLKMEGFFLKNAGSGYHDATIAFHPGNNTVFFSSSNVKKGRLVLGSNHTNNFKLYSGELVDDRIIGKKEVFFNSNDYSIAHPFIDPSGEYLFFSSNMPGGYGMADIYYCRIYDDGSISPPTNAGPMVNSRGNDFFPHIYGGQLYFASNGHLGYGGLDLFKVKMDSIDDTGIQFTELKNLGPSINSPQDDFAIYFDPNKKNTGYVSSNRVNGKGDDDIYYFVATPPKCEKEIKGKVEDINSGLPIQDVRVTANDSLSRFVASTKTDSLGRYSLLVPCGIKGTLETFKAEYLPKSIYYSTSKESKKPLVIDFKLEKAEDRIVRDSVTGVEKIKIDPIYFEFDKWDITPQGAEELDKIMEILDYYPGMTIKIESHTDSRGSAAYNRTLSIKRAQSTRDYLYGKGLDKDRIESAHGFGESRPLIKCPYPDSCSEKEHAMNRRSDFIITKR